MASLVERLRAIAGAPDGADLAELLGVAPGALSFSRDGITVDGETVSYADARAALAVRRQPAGRAVRIEDLDPCRTNSPT